MCVLAIEACLRQPNVIVKYVCPKQKMVKTILKPRMREILEDCPDELRPEYKENDKIYLFPNGSEIQMAGTDNQNYDSIRGGTSVLWIVDEAGFCNDLDSVVFSVLSPTTLTTDGRGILASTPDPDAPEHPFIKEFVEPAKAKGNLFQYTIFENPLIDDVQRQKIIDQYPGGNKNPKFRAEFLCVDENTPVKTRAGYKSIKNVQIGDQVLTHTGKYQKVLNVFKNKLDNRDVYEVRASNGLKHIVTKDHELYTTTVMQSNRKNLSNTNWMKVQDFLKKRVTERIYYKIPIDTNISDAAITNPDVAFLLGWYLAEGHCPKNIQQVILSLNNNDPIDRIQECARNVFGKEFVCYTDAGSCKQWGLNSKVAKAFFCRFGRIAIEKRLLDEIKHANPDIKKIFLDAYFNGDGYRLKKGYKMGCCSISFNLICDISDMLNTLGVACTVQRLHYAQKSVILGRNVNIRDSWQINVHGKNLQIYDNIPLTSKSKDFVKDGYLYSLIRSVKKIEYKKEYVYDIEVETDHSYVGLHGVFHNCEIVRNYENTVIPEFDDVTEKIIVTDKYVRPPYYDTYESMDIGGKDFTVVLFAYYDFLKNTVVIEDEFILKEKQNSEKIKKSVIATQESLWNEKPVYLRFADNNNIILLNDLTLHGLTFIPTRKDNKEAAINDVRIKIMNHQILIHPRCKTLIYHLKYATWARKTDKAISASGYKTFARSADGGHFDALDALIYLIRNVIYGKNPYPKGYDISHLDRQSDNNQYVRTTTKTTHQIVADMFKVRKSIK